MDNLAIKAILILMFVLIISQNFDVSYRPLIIVIGIGMVATLVVQFIKEGGTTSDEVFMPDEEEWMAQEYISFNNICSPRELYTWTR